MTTCKLTLSFLDFWCSPIPGQPGGADRTSFRDERGLPAIDGDTLKGLLRDATVDLEGLQRIPAGSADWMFGTRGTGALERPGHLRFTPAQLSDADAAWALHRGTELLFQTIHQTALDGGVARHRSLRSAEWVVPCDLHARVEGPDPGTGILPWHEFLSEACHLVRQLGASRHRGYGRVRVSMDSPTQADAASSQAFPETDTARSGARWFKVELLSRTLLGSSARTVGHIESLDHIPGNALLGAAIASGGFSTDFFSQVRLTPAYPLDASGALALPVPLCWSLYGTGSKAEIRSHTDGRSESAPASKPSPFKGGFIVHRPDPTSGAEPRHPTNRVALVRPTRTYSAKSARDPDQFDRAADAQFFALDRLEAGQSFAFAVEGPGADEVARRLLSDGVRLGRRRSSGSGQVRITRLLDPPHLPTASGTRSGDTLLLYAWSDLALHEGGLPTLTPTPKAFGLPEEAQWLPEKSALRTRSYAPWNQFHGGFDLERHVICRGSVIAFKLPPGARLPDTLASELWAGVGSYTHEGLGRVVPDPAFLSAPQLVPDPSGASQPARPSTPTSADSALQKWLQSRPSAETSHAERTQIIGLTRRLSRLVAQQQAMGRPIPTASQFRALAQHLGQTTADSLSHRIVTFCNPAAATDDRQRSIRTPLWTCQLNEGSKVVSLLSALQEAAGQHGDKAPDIIAPALLSLASEVARLTRTHP